jgi:hypothetical protein
MRRRSTVALLAALMVMAMTLGASAAFAGEVNGNGDPTPVQDYQAGSICSFSGLNDDPNDPDPIDGGRVQSFGQIVSKSVHYEDDRGASGLVPIIHMYGPGAACRGYASGG